MVFDKKNNFFSNLIVFKLWDFFVIQFCVFLLNIIHAMIGGLVSLEMTSPDYATLSRGIFTLGMLVAAIPAARIIATKGYKNTVLLFSLMSIFGTLLSIFAIFENNFIYFCIGGFFIGTCTGGLAQLRFIALDKININEKGKTASYLVFTGLLAAVLSRNIIIPTKDIFDYNNYSATFLALALASVTMFMLYIFKRSNTENKINENINKTLLKSKSIDGIFSNLYIFKKPKVLLAVFAATIGYSTMVLMMTAAPIELKQNLKINYNHGHGVYSNSNDATIDKHDVMNNTKHGNSDIRISEMDKETIYKDHDDINNQNDDTVNDNRMHNKDQIDDSVKNNDNDTMLNKTNENIGKTKDNDANKNNKNSSSKGLSNLIILLMQAHMISMFLPSLFVGFFINKIGVDKLILAGIIILLATVFAAFNYKDVFNIGLALILLGVAWNFLYVGGTTLLSICLKEEDRIKIQGFNDFIIMFFSAIAALYAGFLNTNIGWNGICYLTLGLTVFLLVFWGKEKFKF